MKKNRRINATMHRIKPIITRSNNTPRTGKQQQQFVPQNQQKMVNYIPPSPPYPRSITQYSQTLSYPFQNYDTCSVNNAIMPPRPETVMISPPPPRHPSNQQNSDSVSAIDAQSGDVRQYFGTFGPSFQHM